MKDNILKNSDKMLQNLTEVIQDMTDKKLSFIESGATLTNHLGHVLYFNYCLAAIKEGKTQEQIDDFYLDVIEAAKIQAKRMFAGMGNCFAVKKEALNEHNRND